MYYHIGLVKIRQSVEIIHRTEWENRFNLILRTWNRHSYTNNIRKYVLCRVEYTTLRYFFDNECNVWYARDSRLYNTQSPYMYTIVGITVMCQNVWWIPLLLCILLHFAHFDIARHFFLLLSIRKTNSYSNQLFSIQITM